jgi:hypothetical protein
MSENSWNRVAFVEPDKMTLDFNQKAKPAQSREAHFPGSTNVGHQTLLLAAGQDSLGDEFVTLPLA